MTLLKALIYFYVGKRDILNQLTCRVKNTGVSHEASGLSRLCFATFEQVDDFIKYKYNNNFGNFLNVKRGLPSLVNV